MNAVIEGSPSFACLHIDLAPGETVVAESGAMAAMSADLEMQARLNGGLVGGMARKFLGGESLFVNHFTNPANTPRRLTLSQASPGDMRQVELKNQAICLQPGAYVASTPGLKLGLKYAGLGSFVGREGLFKLEVSGTGTLWYGAFGALVEKQVNGQYIVDTSHLVAYEPHMKLKPQLAGGIFSSFFSGEGLVTRIEGNGRIVLQTRSLTGMAGWLNPFLPG